MRTYETKAEQREEATERLVEIREEMESLLEEAYRITREHDSTEANRAKAYWYAQIAMALSDDHEYLGSGSHTLQHTIDALEQSEEEEERCESCGGTLADSDTDSDECDCDEKEMADEAERT